MTKFVRQKDLLATFGNPTRQGWAKDNITYVIPPFEMYAGGVRVHHIPIHNSVAEALDAILNEIWMTARRDQKVIHAWGMDAYDGSHVVRAVRGGKRLSAHAWGMAIDIDARHNPLGKKGRFAHDHPVVRIFRSHGCGWGGDFKNRKDPMHFTFSGG